MRGLSPADSGCPTPRLPAGAAPPIAQQLPSCPLLGQWPSHLITSNYCTDCCLGLRSNHSAAVRSPKRVKLSRLDTLSDARPQAARLGSRRQRVWPGERSGPQLLGGVGSGRGSRPGQKTSSGSAGHGQACTGRRWSLERSPALGTSRLPDSSAVRATEAFLQNSFPSRTHGCGLPAQTGSLQMWLDKLRSWWSREGP